MTKKIAALLSIALMVLSLPVSLLAQAIQFNIDFDQAKFVSTWVQDDTVSAATQTTVTAASSPVYWIKYVGTEESGTLDIDTGIEFFSGPLGSEVLDGSAGFDVNTGDVCGTNNDELLTDDAQCDTPEELCQVINDSGAPWICVLGAAFQSDTFNAASAADYVDMADVQAKVPGGVGIYADNSDTDTLSVLVRPDVGYATRLNTNNLGAGDIEWFLNQSTYGSYTQTAKDNPFEGQRVAITYILANLDSTTAWTLEVRARRYRPGGSVDERIVFSTVDTVDVTDEILDFSRNPLVSGPGETFVITASDDALVTGNLSYTAVFLPVP